MNSKTLSIAACLFPIVIMSALAGYRWHKTPTDPRQRQQPVSLLQGGAKGSDSPMFGGSPQRNMVNTIDKNTPTAWIVGDREKKVKPVNIKWVAELGDKSYGGPVIADGQIYVGTNNRYPRDKNVKGPKAILMCFREADGNFLWQNPHDIPADVTSMDALTQGLCSTPVVEGKFLYYLTPGCEIICADVMGNTKWTYDLHKEHKVTPHHLANCSPLVVGDLVMVITGNGVDDEGKLHAPKAPSFVAINKKTGKLAWQSSLPGDKIIEGQWSNPTLAQVNGKPQVIFAGGDSVLYSFEPETGNLIWKCDCVPVRKKKGDREIDNYIVATPVVVGDRLYVGLGVYPENPHATRSSHFLCLDITKKGDVSPKSYDVKDAKNKDSALVWAFGGPINPPPPKGRQVYFGRTISTASVHDGLVYIAEEPGYLHCLDAKTGERYWDHDFKASVWGSTYWVDGKIYIGNEDGDIVIFAHGKVRKIIATVNMDDVVHSTPVVANGVLYVTTKAKLYAIR
ncbi:MAG: hypothetical protein EXR98_16850 [Gemmataceae bacterium]|nr:hypothetical protein [Gemmataceae bacterium]